MFPDAEGIYTFTTPSLGGEGKVPTIAVDADFGEMVHGMFLDPLRWKDQTIQLVSDTFTWEDMVKTFTEGNFRDLYVNSNLFHY